FAAVSLLSGAWMGLVVNFEQSLGINAGIDLCGRKARMAQQFLNGSEITAASQQMGGERVAQSVWRGAVGQTKTSAQLLHFSLDDGCMKHATLGSTKKRFVGGKIERAKRPILRYR